MYHNSTIIDHMYYIRIEVNHPIVSMGGYFSKGINRLVYLNIELETCGSGVIVTI